MVAKQHYHVSEFADMAGVTVRTLQYYDRIGVLTPAQKTEAQHRLYERNDLLRLQQILTLKQLGFTLSEIKQMLQHPDYDLRSALYAQKQAIDHQIAQLQQVSSAMDNAMLALEETDDWDWEQVQFIIQGMTDRRYLEWIRKYFSDEQIAQITGQSHHMSLEEIQQSHDAWRQVASGIRENRHLPPDHPILQAIAKKAHDLVQAFTQGDQSIEESLVNMYGNPQEIPEAYKVFDDELFEFYRQVMTIYQANIKPNNE